MHGMRRRTFMAALAACALLPVDTAFAAGVRVDEPHARPPLGAGRVAAAYMTLVDTGGQGDRLLRAESDIAERVELHTHIREQTPGGHVVMKMRQVPHIDIPAGGDTRLRPGGLHVMLIGVRRKLRPGDSFRLRLEFEKAGPVEITVPVRPLSATMRHRMDGMREDGRDRRER